MATQKSTPKGAFAATVAAHDASNMRKTPSAKSMIYGKDPHMPVKGNQPAGRMNGKC